MKTKKLRFQKGFTVALGNKRSEAATMVIAIGEKEGGLDKTTTIRGLDLERMMDLSTTRQRSPRRRKP